VNSGVAKIVFLHRDGVENGEGVDPSVATRRFIVLNVITECRTRDAGQGRRSGRNPR